VPSNLPRWLRYDPDEDVSRHGATDRQKCLNMEKKYGWKMVRVEKTSDRILKVDCVFKGKTEFPNYLEEQEED
jgi:hypothetical protein